MNYAMFRKPSRYIGNEINITRKEGGVKVALCFPDTYEIGMSHTGLKILYSIINNIPQASAERVYAPWEDLESYLRGNNMPLTSLEYQRPLKEFDIIGFTLQYELSYTNVLNMLDLGRLPIRSAERGDGHPLVIAGGPCTVNPLPLAPFIDAFVIGDGEDIIKEIIGAYGESVKERGGILEALSKIDGVYVPSLHDISTQKIKRRIVEDLDHTFFPEAPPVPYTSIVHNRVAIEISRGCTKGCRFCQAGMICRPLRERSPGKVLSLAQNSISNTGFEEISFTSLSAGDYTHLLPLIKGFNRLCAKSRTSVSLPSLRVGAINSEVLKEIKSVRKTGFTIAPEAGTKRLREVINKDFTYEEYEETLNKLFAAGWSTIKLYFMIGLPTETMTDIDGLIDMAAKALKAGRKITGKRVNINAGISAFVPKAHTPFQWTGQNSLRDLREKQDHIRRAFRKLRINFKGQHVEPSLLEAVFARADKESASLLENAWRLGCRFDGWSEKFDFEKWELAAKNTGIDLYEYAMRQYDPDDALPWDFIDTGITKEFLQTEFLKALKGETTPDCRENCSACGLQCKDTREETGETLQIPESPAHVAEQSTQVKYRVKFSKRGILRMLSHQELMTSILRAIRRAGIRVAYSSGFHPHPRIAFGPALASGIEGLNEFFDVELTAFINPSDFQKMLNSRLPEGLQALSAASIPLHTKSLNNSLSAYEYEVTINRKAGEQVSAFMDQKTWPVAREKKDVDIRPMVGKAEIHGDKLRLILADTEGASVRLFEILREMLQVSTEEIYSFQIKRTGLYSYNMFKQLCP